MIATSAHELTRRTRALVALGSGVVFATTSPPIDLHAGVLLGLAGFAVALGGVGPDRLRQGFFYGGCFGLGANLVALRFVPEVILRFTSLPAAAAYLACFRADAIVADVEHLRQARVFRVAVEPRTSLSSICAYS